MPVRTALIAVPACLVFAICPAGAGDLPESGPPLHPYSTIGTGSADMESGAPEAITPLDAAGFAAGVLAGHGVTDILVCEVHRIEAPLTGYLVDALGSLPIPGARFDTFRVGIRDGRESDGTFAPAGEEFAFLAMGVDADGGVCWIPAPGPGFAQVEGMLFDEVLLDYEFLLWREDFESLGTRFPRDLPAGSHCGSCGGHGADPAGGCGGSGCP